jgi:hypothetical protein
VFELDELLARDWDIDDHGNLLPVKQWPDRIAAAVSSIEVVKKNLVAGDGQTDIVCKIKLRNKPKNVDLLFRHLGLLEETREDEALRVPLFTLPNNSRRPAVHLPILDTKALPGTAPPAPTEPPGRVGQ